MKFIKILQTILEGGNVSINTGKTLYWNSKNKKFSNEFTADFIEVGSQKKPYPSQIKFRILNLLELLNKINQSYENMYSGEEIWPNLPKQTSGKEWEDFKYYFSGSTFHFAGLIDNALNIPDFYTVKKKVGDIDIKVNSIKEKKIKKWLKTVAKKDFPITGIKFWLIKNLTNEQIEIINSLKSNVIKEAIALNTINNKFFIPNNNNKGWNIVRDEIKKLKQFKIIRRFYEVLPSQKIISQFWFMGFNPSGEQDITLWSFPKYPKASKVTNERIDLQMDFEYMNLGENERPADEVLNIASIGKIVGAADFYPKDLGSYTIGNKNIKINYPGVHKAKGIESFTTGDFTYKDFFVIKKKGIIELQKGNIPSLDDKKSFEKRNEKQEWVLGSDVGLRRDYEFLDKDSAKLLGISEDVYKVLTKKIGSTKIYLDYDILKSISLYIRDEIFKRFNHVPDIEKKLKLPENSLANFSVLLPHIIDNIKNGNEVVKNKKQIIKYIDKMNQRSLQFRFKEESVIKKLPGFLLLKRLFTESNSINEKWLLDISLYILQKESKDLERSIKKNTNIQDEVSASLLDVNNLNKALQSNFKVSGILQWKNLEQLKNNINDENNREKVNNDILADKTLTFFPELKIED